MPGPGTDWPWGWCSAPTHPLLWVGQLQEGKKKEPQSEASWGGAGAREGSGEAGALAMGGFVSGSLEAEGNGRPRGETRPRLGEWGHGHSHEVCSGGGGSFLPQELGAGRAVHGHESGVMGGESQGLALSPTRSEADPGQPGLQVSCGWGGKFRCEEPAGLPLGVGGAAGRTESRQDKGTHETLSLASTTPALTSPLSRRPPWLTPKGDPGGSAKASSLISVPGAALGVSLRECEPGLGSSEEVGRLAARGPGWVLGRVQGKADPEGSRGEWETCPHPQGPDTTVGEGSESLTVPGRGGRWREGPGAPSSPGAAWARVRCLPGCLHKKLQRPWPGTPSSLQPMPGRQGRAQPRGPAWAFPPLCRPGAGRVTTP